MSNCKQCGLQVQWKRDSERSPWQCFNPDGSVHWDLCSATRFQKIKRTGRPFKEETLRGKIEGYKTPLKKSGEQLTRIEALRVRGDRYKHSRKCKDCVPPWEICERCPDRPIRPADGGNRR